MAVNRDRCPYAGKPAYSNNCSYDQATAEERIAAGDADLITFGRPFISNPDLVHRFANDLELNPDAEMSICYSPIGRQGYTDFPVVAREL